MTYPTYYTSISLWYEPRFQKNFLSFLTHLLLQGRRGEQVAHLADRGHLPDDVPGGGGDGRHHEVLLHELRRRQSTARASIARQVRGGCSMSEGDLWREMKQKFHFVHDPSHLSSVHLPMDIDHFNYGRQIAEHISPRYRREHVLYTYTVREDDRSASTSPRPASSRV